VIGSDPCPVRRMAASNFFIGPVTVRPKYLDLVERHTRLACIFCIAVIKSAFLGQIHCFLSLYFACCYVQNRVFGSLLSEVDFFAFFFRGNGEMFRAAKFLRLLLRIYMLTWLIGLGSWSLRVNCRILGSL